VCVGLCVCVRACVCVYLRVRVRVCVCEQGRRRAACMVHARQTGPGNATEQPLHDEPACHYRCH